MYVDLERKYILMDFKLSHNELLFRASKNDNYFSNVDIVFKGVTSINLITTFKGFCIDAIEKKQNQTCHVGLDLEPFIFQIKDKFGTNAYIEASAFGVFSNKLDFGVSSLGDFLWSPENKCLYWSHEDKEFKNRFSIK